MVHFSVNHLLIGVSLLVASHFAPAFFGWAQVPVLKNAVKGLPFLGQLFLAVLAADLVQYVVHRCFHEVPFLWRVHAVHHCPESMDWLSGSRQHFLEVTLTRALVFVPIFVLGFPKGVIDAYVILVGFQAVFNHANVAINFGPLAKVLVTPQFHHWHHATDPEAIDRNYAAHFSFLDSLFGTRVASNKEWPEKYGILGKQLPANYWAHWTHPFKS